MKRMSQWITYLSLVCMVGTSWQWAFFFTLAQLWIPQPAYATDELKTRLEAKYNLTNGTINTDNTLYNKAMAAGAQAQAAATDLETKVLNTDYGTGSTVNINGYQELDFSEVYSDYMGSGLESYGPSAPATTADGNGVAVNYYENGSVSLSRDEQGNLVTTELTPEQRGTNITSAKNKEVFSNQLDNPDVSFNAPSKYGDEDGYTDEIRAKYGQMSTGTTYDAQAYRAVIKADEVNSTKVPTDAYYLQNGNNAVADANNGRGIWASTCNDTTSTTTNTRHYPAWEHRICAQPNYQNLDHCEVTRVLKADGDIVNVPAAASFGYRYGTYLTVYADFVNGTATVTDKSDFGSSEFHADIEQIDFALLCERNNGFANLESSEYWKNFPLGGDSDKSIRMVELQAPTCENGMVAKLSIEDKTHSNDKDHNLAAQFHYVFQTSGYHEEFKQSPEGCADAIGWKPGPYPCIDGNCYQPANEVNEFCTFSDWEVIEQGTNSYSQDVITPLNPLFPEDPNPAAIFNADENGLETEESFHLATWKINAKNYSCDPLKGNQYCAQVYNPDTEAYEQQCYTYQQLQETEGSCMQYAENSLCQEDRRSCAEGWMDEQTGICYLFSVDYRCDVGSDITTTSTTTTNSCASMLPCMGTGSCDYGEEETSDDFQEAVLMASIAQYTEGDGTCASSDPSTCTIFPGEHEYCSWEVTGVGNNCCEAPSGIDVLGMAYTGYKMMQSDAFKAVSNELSTYVPDSVSGLYNEAGQMLSSAWGAASQKVVEFTTSVFGDSSKITEWVSDMFSGSDNPLGDGMVDQLMERATQQMYNFINSLLPDTMSSMVFTASNKAGAQAGDVMLNDTAQSVVNVISFVGTVYTYYTMAKMLINMLTACDENEMDMGVKIAQRMCFKVGNAYCTTKVLGVCLMRRQDWCCYSSILARIIGEQGSEQLGKDMTTCPGFTIDEFSSINFDQLDLSEWLSLMYESDILSDSGYDTERLTGTGRLIGNDEDTGQVRMNAESRAQNEFSGTTMSDNANTNKNNFSVEDIDCSQYPRPLICELQ